MHNNIITGIAIHKITLKNLFSQRPKYILCGSFVDAIERITKNKSPRKKSYIAMLETIGAQNIDDKYWAGFSRSHHININQPNTINTTAKITSQHGLIYSKIAKNYGGDNTKIVLTTGLSGNQVFKIGSETCTMPETMIYLTTFYNQYEDMILVFLVLENIIQNL